jgi:epoxyqueuosine reductase
MASALQAEPRLGALGTTRNYPSECTILQERQAMSSGRVSFRDQVSREGGGPSATARVKDAAFRLGFDAVGIARADVPIGVDIERYDAFIAAGMHGEMQFLARHRDARARMDGEGVLLGAKSVICVARRYPRRDAPPRSAGAGALEPDADVGGVGDGIAMYARGRDYHKFLRRKIRQLATFVRALGGESPPQGGEASATGPSADTAVRARPLCDEEPVLERAWAARAGLGFIGKNGLLIVPGIGSMVLLGEVVTTLELEPDVPMAERCGACTRCLEACPTAAFVRPFVLDPRRCVAYLTIEHRSAVPADLATGVGSHVFGCDDCQTVCPFNASAAARARGAGDDPFAPLDRWSRLRLEDFLSVDDAGWRVLSEGTPLKRAGRVSLARNAAIVLGNRGDPASLPALQAAADGHDDARVRDAARAAIQRIRGAGSAG